MRKIREVLRLYYAAGMSVRAIARSVKASPSTVGEYIRRAEVHGVGWSDFATGVPVPDASHPHANPSVTPLSLCAGMGAALACPERGPRHEPRTAGWRVLESLRAHFPDSSAQSRT